MLRNFLFVDGSNLYNAQYELFGPDQYIDFALLIKVLEKFLHLNFDRVYFYASYSPRPNQPTTFEKKYLKNEALFYQSVKRTSKTIFFKGYRSKTSRKEKEVDVKLSVDIVDFAHRRKYSQLFLFSGDAAHKKDLAYMYARQDINILSKNI